MRYRALSANRDFQFGQANRFLVNSPAAVAQAVLTRLNLWAGEWFLDADEGTAYAARVLGYNTQGTRDVEIKARILDTPGVRTILTYSSSVVDRVMTVTALIETNFGQAAINAQV